MSGPGPTLDLTARLLADVFPAARISRPDYLRWLYDDSPFGAVLESNLDDPHGRSGHYAVVPLGLMIDGVPIRGGLSLNTAVHERARGGGVFVRLAEETYAAASRHGIRAIVGVANANSTPGFVRRLRFTLVASLPVSVLPAIPTRGRVVSGWADDPMTFCRGGAGHALERVLAAPPQGLSRSWDEETFRWRLRSPGTRYALHRTGGALVVSTLDSRRGIRVAIVLAVLAPAPIPAAQLRLLVWAVCRTHRAPVAVHAGVNVHARFRGITLPDRLRESPLNLIYRWLDGDATVPSIGRFEFFDFDAY